MTHLLDAHTLIWSQDDPNRLGATAGAVLQNRASVLGVGIETLWEIGIKVSLGKLKLAKPYRQWVDTAIADLGLAILPVGLDHVERQTTLPFHHRDPFDRLLAAQSLVENLPVVSNDTVFDLYGVPRVWD